MNREYTREQYLERVSWVKAAKRPISMTTDIIVGFPGETAGDFIETMDLLAEVQYDAVFAFKYSPRPNTPAIHMADSIPEEEKSQRLQSLLDRQREIQRINYNKQIGDIYEAAVEGHNQQRGQVIGRNEPEQDIELHYGEPDSASARKLCAGSGDGGVSE